MKLFPVFGPGHPPGEKFHKNSPIFEQEGTSSLNHYIITPPHRSSRSVKLAPQSKVLKNEVVSWRPPAGGAPENGPTAKFTGHHVRELPGTLKSSKILRKSDFKACLMSNGRGKTDHGGWPT